MTTKNRGGYWGTAGARKKLHLPQYDSFMGMRGVIGGLLEMILNLLGFGRKLTNFSPCLKELDPISFKFQSKESSEFRVTLPQKYIIMMNFSSIAKRL